ncbi:hypothetical protein B0G74_6485 [Paraburkholderia sp. BL9I2N2]|nr:hypothetical protein B0G74_6485 [Paraburkholderia sp. BL9I2N2]
MSVRAPAPAGSAGASALHFNNIATEPRYGERAPDAKAISATYRTKRP